MFAPDCRGGPLPTRFERTPVARIRPFRAWTYARSDRDVSRFTAPPYDVISAEERARLLAKSDHNVVALELPDGALDPGAPGNRYETGAATWAEWREDGALVRDERPTLYVLEQRYESPADLSDVAGSSARSGCTHSSRASCCLTSARCPRLSATDSSSPRRRTRT